MLQWASFCYDWARSDPRIVGLNPWHWSGTPGAGEFQPGMAEMPAVLAAVSSLCPTTYCLATWYCSGLSAASAKLGACLCRSHNLEQYQKIGKEIVSGRQADIDFSRFGLAEHEYTQWIQGY